LAQVLTASTPFYTDSDASRLQGTNAIAGTPVSYTWDLQKTR
jgi:hypothetical protein